MKKLIFISLVLCVAIINFNCEKQAPVSPEVNQIEMTQLAKANEWTSFTAYARDWFVVSQPYGNYTFAQFDFDDDDVKQTPSGTLILRDRVLRSPIDGDITSESGKAIWLVLSATMHSEGDELLGGPAHGTLSISGKWNGLEGTFEGHFVGKFSDERDQDQFEGNFHAQGTSGEFVGMKMKGIMIEGEPGPYDYNFKLEGHIFN